ncbi:hypothetical protein WICMUC_005235 [Wickerhamomyces mucosus]|uniref:Thioredoxin domain-containing protein n=1 Tax=Wickerhamomyces mucosus TaxID=1378264 RepID=A0A9P8T767_9ASCO|nr:hypothetical protein WICMUC_005235 [Wickerhamomyces mucosus]
MKLSSILSLLPLVSANFYTKDPNVFELTAQNFDEIVLHSNQTSLVEFYAPWCGHCQRLKGEFSNVGKHLKDIATVGAINCDVASNKKICSKYRVEGYPTLIGFRPPKFNLDDNNGKEKKFQHATEIYNGPRKTKPLVSFVTSRMKNYVKRIITEEKLLNWVKNFEETDNERIKIVVFTKKDKLSSLLKSIAIDLLGIADVVYFPVRANTVITEFDVDKDSDKAELYVIPNGNLNEKVKYTGDVAKQSIVEFLTQFESIEPQISKVLTTLENREDIINGKKKQSKKSKKNHEKDEL